MKRLLNRLFDYFIVLLLVVIASFSIAFGLYLERVNTKKNIIDNGIDFISEKALNYIDDFDYFKTNNNFSIEADLKLNINSDEYKNKSINDNKYKEKLNLINNLSNMDYKLTYIQNNNKKESFFEILEKLKEEEIVSYKKVVSNSTDYKLINKVLNNYVNNGTNYYFETITEENTTKDNIKYLYEKLVEALKNSIKEEYLDEKLTTTYVIGGQKELMKLSLHLDDKTIHSILNDILEYLQSDEKTKNLLSNIDEDFLNYKVSEDKIIIEKDEDVNINVYYGGIFPKIEKIEYYYLKGDNKKVLYATGDSNKGEIYYVENDSTKYIMNYNISNNIKIEIKDNKDNQIGLIDYSKANDNILLTYRFDSGKSKQDLSYTSKYFNEEKAYRNEKIISWKHTDNNVIKMEFNAELNYTNKENATVEEDVSQAVLKSTLTDEQQKAFNDYKDSIKERLKNE